MLDTIISTVFLVYFYYAGTIFSTLEKDRGVVDRFATSLFIPVSKFYNLTMDYFKSKKQ